MPDLKNTISFLALLVIIILSVPVFAGENIMNIQTDQTPEKQQAIDNNTQPGELQPEEHQPEKPQQDKSVYTFLNNSSITNASNQTTKTDSLTNEALSVSVALVVILLMIFSLAWLMKKMGYTSVTGQGKLKIIASLNMGQKEKIALIQVGSQQLLVGMTATHINTLHVLKDTIEEADEKQVESSDKEKTLAHKFSTLIKQQQSNIK